MSHSYSANNPSQLVRNALRPHSPVHAFSAAAANLRARLCREQADSLYNIISFNKNIVPKAQTPTGGQRKIMTAQARNLEGKRKAAKLSQCCA